MAQVPPLSVRFPGEPTISRMITEFGFPPAVVDAVLALPTATATFNSYVSGAQGIVTGAINSVRFNLGDIYQSIKSLLLAGSGATVDAMGGLADVIYREITDYVRASNAIIQANINSLSEAAIREAKETAAQVAEVLGDAQNTIVSTLRRSIEIQGEVQIAQSKAIMAVVEPGLELVQETADEIVEQATGFATALREAIPSLGEAITGALDTAQEYVVDGIKDAAGTVLSSFFGDIAGEAVERIEPLIKMFEDELPEDSPLRALTAPGVLPVAAIGGLMAGIALPMIISSVASTALSPFAEKLRHVMNGIARSGQLGPGEAIQAHQRGMMAADLTQTILNHQGLPDNQADALRELVMQRPGTMEVIDYWRRELMTPLEADDALHRLGWNEGYRDLLREAAYPPPGVGDLITMAVREVFSPEVAERFGQFDEIPDDYMMWAKRVGLNDYWARNYWAAHWSLPSIMQGFEMLHRDVITSDDLDRLFVALDVMPFWRDQLKAISYSPFTRVDVRRMYQQKIIGPGEVKTAYKDIGYDDAKAQLLTDFTIKYVDGLVKVVKSKERDLSKGDVIGLLNDGVISPGDADAYLQQLGYSSDEATVLVQREAIQEERKERKAEIELIIDQAQIKVLSFEQAQDRLARLDLSPIETRKAVASLTRAIEARTRTPSKSDLDNWLEIGLLSPQEYEIELQALGYPDKYIALYLEARDLETDEDILAAESRAAGKREPRIVTKGQLDQLYIGEIILEEEYTEGLEALGYRQGDINNFLDASNVKLDEKQAQERDRIARGELAPRRERIPSRTLLGKMYLKRIIGIGAYEEGLKRLGFNPANITLLSQLIIDKLEAEMAEVV